LVEPLLLTSGARACAGFFSAIAGKLVIKSAPSGIMSAARDRARGDTNQEQAMSKAQDNKKETKKEPAKTMKEKKEAKKAKKEERAR
jgi:hypothetical protein